MGLGFGGLGCIWEVILNVNALGDCLTLGLGRRER